LEEKYNDEDDDDDDDDGKDNADLMFQAEGTRVFL